MKKYLLDTDIAVFYLRGKNNINLRLKEVNDFASKISILPIFNSLDLCAREKARLKKAGQLIDDFDLLIGCSVIKNNMILVTNNESHFYRIKDILMENWAKW